MPVMVQEGSFIADDAPLENTDVVLWYTLGLITSCSRSTGR